MGSTKKNREEELSLRNLTRQYDIVLVAYVLKQLTDREHAMSCGEIVNHLSGMIVDEKSELFNLKTTVRKVEYLEMLHSEDWAMLNQYVAPILGGVVRSREADGIYLGKNTTSPGVQKRYYFEPFLTDGDMHLIYGSLRSSRYLSEEEKDYLLKRLGLLHPTSAQAENTLARERQSGVPKTLLPPRPEGTRKSMATQTEYPLPGVGSNMLRNIEIINYAIEQEVQLEIDYGIYDIAEGDTKVHFRSRYTQDRIHILNPYAMLWNDGEYYLIGIFEPYTEPTQLRVDRIINVKIHCQVLEDMSRQECPRRDIPKVLFPFYKKDSNGRVYFDGISFANTFPNMIIHQEPNRVSCTFECTKSSLQIVIDNFGLNVRVRKSTIPHPKQDGADEETNEEYFLATVQNVQYENVLHFAVNHCKSLTLTEPREMVLQVRAELQAAIDRLSQQS